MNRQLEQELIERLDATHPATVLIVAPEMSVNLRNHLQTAVDSDHHHIVFENIETSISPLGRYEFIAVADTLEELRIDQAEQLIFHLRDLHGKLLWVMVPSGQAATYGSRNAVAQGMRMVNPQHFGSGQSQWYEYSLEFYKPVPQWLNASHWANPERWDEERW